jgi:hypothetical protein
VFHRLNRVRRRRNQDRLRARLFKRLSRLSQFRLLYAK